MSAIDPLSIQPQDYSTVDFYAFAYRNGTPPQMAPGLQGASVVPPQSFAAGHSQPNRLGGFETYLQPNAATSANVGVGSIANGASSVAVGPNAYAKENNGTAVGSYATASATDALAIGANTNATGINAAAIGYFARAVGQNSIAIGHSAIATGNNSTVLGNGASSSNSSDVVIGENASCAQGDSVAIGHNASCAGSASVSIGFAANGTLVNGTMAIGFGASDSAGGIAFGFAAVNLGLYSIAIGNSAVTTATRQFVIGAADGLGYLTDMYVGAGVAGSAGRAFTIHASGAAGTNVDGDGLILAGGIGTGTGVGGSVKIQTAIAGSSGSSLNTLADRVTVDQKGNVVLGTAALGTTATDGFFYADSCAGLPTGTPTTFTGRVPIVIDTTNSKLMAYLGGSWKGVTLS